MQVLAKVKAWPVWAKVVGGVRAASVMAVPFASKDDGSAEAKTDSKAAVEVTTTTERVVTTTSSTTSTTSTSTTTTAPPTTAPPSTAAPVTEPPTTAAPRVQLPPTTEAPYVPPTTNAPSSVYYANCAAARAAGAAPLYRGDPGYRSALDRDGDGVACEK